MNEKHLNDIEDITEKAAQYAQGALREGQDRVGGFLTRVEEKLYENPWPFIGGAALGMLAVGYRLGQRRP